jgi:hypothetical protein
MMKSNRDVCSFGVLMIVAFMATGTVMAADSCTDLQYENAKLKEKVNELQAELGQSPAPENSPAQMSVSCSSINLRTAQLHVKCTTSMGAVYERVSRDNFGESWKGPDGLIWSDRVGSRSESDTQYNAVEMCKNLGGALPSKADFERGEANGFREVLPNMKDRTFWSSSINPAVAISAYYFDDDGGDLDLGYRGKYSSVRCVER